ncbi:MAG: LysR family transcriptional regulator [Mesorhizobium sp.]|uniref:LysR substrate-binding domain-containing protein n=1 Tax=Mesorhizobium sp. TaxID=1871066 RepID=UPI001203E5EF|nr:LysR substrate-binding domain-containing protein [Mesorhizobium sp.]TIQ37434.1 MAG: LysR family transcriptional regulator [Mesorhizobium sp.]
MRSLPPLAQLRAFEAAARLLSFKEAADELAVMPTAISHQIKLLESYCGRPLFRRRPRPLALTEAGARLLPVIREGLDSFANVLSAIRESPLERSLKVSTTNAFASRWLVPRLPMWRAAHPGISLEIIGTDRVLNLQGGECDIAIRWTWDPPADFATKELFRSKFLVLCSPNALPDGKPLAGYHELKNHTVIHWYWSPQTTQPPTWRWWLDSLRAEDHTVPFLEELDQLTFREELHAIDAVIAGQGIAICDDRLVGEELRSGRLVKAIDREIAGAGSGYYVLYRADHPNKTVIEEFFNWAKSMP